MTGKPLTYDWLGLYPPPDEGTKIYPAEKKDLATIRRETLKKLGLGRTVVSSRKLLPSCVSSTIRNATGNKIRETTGVLSTTTMGSRSFSLHQAGGSPPKKNYSCVKNNMNEYL